MSTPRSLHWQWWATTIGFVLAAVMVFTATRDRFSMATAAMWATAAAIPLGYVLWFLRDSLALNRAPETAALSDGGVRIYPTLGIANGVTVVRGWLFAGVAGFILVVPPVESAWRWLPVGWYGIGVTLDLVDGLLAKTIGRRTVLGEKLDMAFDTLGFLVAPLVGVVWGRIPVWYLSLSAARYLFKFGCWQRRQRGRSVGELPPSSVRRLLAGIQMAFITVALLPVVPASAVRPAAAVVLLPSLLLFARDYLAVAGLLGKESDRVSKDNNQTDPPVENIRE
ncbi:MAG: CDP-alcohol phosphatidyltransferase family protein [Halolamina sp.]|uniref:CDP-alcohol phosphatidyltransferase family protein n=1 Tax=Halolamina sp. TaxID=1940283 RepID=UPI002FC33EC7